MPASQFIYGNLPPVFIRTMRSSVRDLENALRANFHESVDAKFRLVDPITGNTRALAPNLTPAIYTVIKVDEVISVSIVLEQGVNWVGQQVTVIEIFRSNTEFRRWKKKNSFAGVRVHPPQQHVVVLTRLNQLRSGIAYAPVRMNYISNENT